MIETIVDTHQKLPDTIIDFHVHLFPDKLFDAIWQHFVKLYQWKVIHRIYYQECIEYLYKRGVRPVVYSNYAHKEGVAEGLNQWNMEILDEIPDLYCFAAYHPDDANALQMAERVLAHPKVLGFKLQLLVQNFYPHDERLFPLYEMVMVRKKRLLFHVGTGPAGNEFVGIKHFRKVLDRYPDLPANVAHMGAFEIKEFLDLLADHPNIYLDTAFTFSKSMEMRFDLAPDLLEKNKGRILYGSDFPNLIFPREEEIQTLLDYNLSTDAYQKIFRKNGAHLIDTHSGT